MSVVKEEYDNLLNTDNLFRTEDVIVKGEGRNWSNTFDNLVLQKSLSRLKSQILTQYPKQFDSTRDFELSITKLLAQVELLEDILKTKKETTNANI